MSTAAPAARASRTTQPRPLPGGTLVWGNLDQFFRETIPLMQRLPREHGDAVDMRFGPFHMWAISNADAVRHVLQTNARNYKRPANFATALRHITPRSLFVDEGED